MEIIEIKSHVKRLLSVALIALGLISQSTRCEEVSKAIFVITGVDTKVENMQKGQLIDLFMGKSRTLPNGAPAEAVELMDDSTVKARFYKLLTGLDLARVNAYWSRIRFTGRARPPKEFETEQALLSYIQKNSGAIAYLDYEPTSQNIRVLYILND